MIIDETTSEKGGRIEHGAKTCYKDLEFERTGGKGMKIKAFEEDEFGNRKEVSVFLEFEEMEKLIEMYRE